MYILNQIKNDIVKAINKALKKELVNSLDLVYPPNADMGDLSFTAFKISQELGQSPNDICKNIIDNLDQIKGVKQIQTSGPYLNFILDTEVISEKTLQTIAKLKEKYGYNQNKKGQKIMIEFAEPNPFKAFHIGHLRNIILGESLVRLFESQGAKVIRVNYQGDVGMHIAKCLWSFRQVKKSAYPETADEKVALIGKCYAEGAKAFEESPTAQEEIKEINKKIYSKQDKEINQLWDLGKKWSLEKFHEIYDRVYSYFDREYMESEMIKDSYKYIKQAKEKKILKDSQGAVIFDGQKYGLETRVFLNAQGLPTYEGKELALAHRQFKDFGKLDLCIHNVAIEQISFFKATFKVEELLNEKLFKGKQYHNAYEFVGLKSGKMSSRKGQVVLGNDILNEANSKIGEIIKDREEIKDLKDTAEKVGIGAVKYSFLKISPFKYLAFDMAESVSFEGNSGPYIQYVYVRIQSILKKSGVKIKFKNISKFLKEKREEELLVQLSKFNEVVEKSSNAYDPSEIAKYVFDLAKMFNDYYQNVSILNSDEDTKNARLALISAIAQVIKNSLDLLGIKTVEKM